MMNEVSKSSDRIEAHLISVTIVLGPYLADTQQSYEEFGRRSPTLTLEVPLLTEIIL
jgi:hypothetical protein